MTIRTASQSSAAHRTSRAVVAATLVVMGLVLVSIVGFAQPQALHNAAHDTRHALSFPCH